MTSGMRALRAAEQMPEGGSPLTVFFFEDGFLPVIPNRKRHFDLVFRIWILSLRVIRDDRQVVVLRTRSRQSKNINPIILVFPQKHLRSSHVLSQMRHQPKRSVEVLQSLRRKSLRGTPGSGHSRNKRKIRLEQDLGRRDVPLGR